MSKVLVLNSTYQPLNVTSMKRALKMLYLKKAETVKHNGVTITTPRFVISVPSIIRLFSFIAVPHRPIPLSRNYVLMRDRYTCQYCGKQEFKHMTIDHVIPKSQGGKSTWENLVCACRQCNNRKNNRPPREASMSLRAKPERPHFKYRLYIQLQEIPEEWRPFLEEHYPQEQN
jgi:5-methylcytosine-specific restriction endonuclease McrA